MLPHRPLPAGEVKAGTARSPAVAPAQRCRIATSGSEPPIGDLKPGSPTTLWFATFRPSASQLYQFSFTATSRFAQSNVSFSYGHSTTAHGHSPRHP